ncbi:related to PYC1 Pyruvate carboxylase 1 [Rhynchosporium agropyri]|uniref:Related to PYC1 Pyruvate carboxylase 1 n=1 Tax=Rhynchosporium agropyri TaxID=914238 RepID=A0A1E1K857_9HELO|nr:related to PYC1 Pyruvate carboxylase 1 [Rhynchosporium agropyri]
MASARQIKRLLVANRGEIATRIISTARELEIETYSIYTPNDTSHTFGPTHSIQLSSPASYLDIAELVTIAIKHRIDTIHPGYGFLSESPEFARRMWDEAGVLVIGPGPEILARTGDKLQARLLAEECKVPVLPAINDSTNDVDVFKRFAKDVGYPIFLKAVDGGGGRGIRIVRDEKVVASLVKRALQESPSGKAFAEKAAIDGYRHVEVQIIGDGQGNVRHLWERECSMQRRFQKVVEFAPSSIKDRKLVGEVINAALRMARKVNYMSLGTFEFLVKEEMKEFYFLEINPRLQVEHTITESIAMGIDLVKMQLQLAQGYALSSLSLSNLAEDPETPPPLYSTQLRITAEDVSNDWSLSVGKISSFRLPTGNGIRVDTHLIPGQPVVIGTEFDILVAKIIITAPSWEDVVAKAKRALADTHIEGVKTSLDVLRGIVASEAFNRQICDTQWLEASLPSILESGKAISAALDENSILTAANPQMSYVAAAASNVIFRKGDAWCISLAPEYSSKGDSNTNEEPAPSHLQLIRVLRNEFPSSLTASILYTTPSTPQPVPYTLTLASTTASSGSLASASTHRRGDPGNLNHTIIPFPGQLMEILVDEGDVVKEGETVAVVRQMKMELEIRAKRGGRVVWVYEGEEGDEVGEGILVVEIDGGAKL